ncbi:hypothetical protein K8R47_03155 [archaeon]|nr:hypothetical protein [archaeon]
MKKHHKIKINYWKMITIFMAVLFIASIFTSGFGFLTAKPKQQVAEEAVAFINTNLLTGGNSVVLDSVSKEGCLYKMDLSLEEQKLESYVTKDGNLLFPQAIILKTEETQEPEIQNTPTGATTFCDNAEKNDKPIVELFVMSQCPYGTIAEEAMYPVYKLIKNQIDFKLYFIAEIYESEETFQEMIQSLPENYRDRKNMQCNKKEDGKYYCSLHGQPEVDENLRQICAIEHYPDKYFSYIQCVNENYVDPESVWESCASKFDIDTNIIKTCSEGEEGRQLLRVNIKRANELQVSGSPTLIINGKTYTGQRIPQSFQEAVCCSFNTEPETCSQEITEQVSAVDGSC